MEACGHRRLTNNPPTLFFVCSRIRKVRTAEGVRVSLLQRGVTSWALLGMTRGPPCHQAPGLRTLLPWRPVSDLRAPTDGAPPGPCGKVPAPTFPEAATAETSSPPVHRCGNEVSRGPVPTHCEAHSSQSLSCCKIKPADLRVSGPVTVSEWLQGNRSACHQTRGLSRQRGLPVRGPPSARSLFRGPSKHRVISSAILTGGQR